MRLQQEPLEAELAHLESLWEGGIEDAYTHYAALSESRVALAAALVEAGIALHGLGHGAAPPGELLLSDLCLARASRLAAAWATREVQVGLALAIEEASGAAAAGRTSEPIRRRLTAVLQGAS
ncbi:MAG: hypothetical protein LBJ87_01995 [bacterium]|jgi:hypothetical protein|nr:hypothetical protein [bacterium]